MKLTTLAQGLLMAGLVSTSALAQDRQRIEITGSRIKRVASEGALPVQTIRAAELEKSGITNVEQLVSILSANGNGQDNLVSNQGGDFLNSLSASGRGANNGSSGVSLRGLGPQNTLVLLNGRRVSSHGLNGKSVDLNSIPIAAIDRIEILKDGASAIYGTDAIGGVMNFILKRNFTGLETTLTGDVTQGGGGDILKGSLTYGLGDLDKQGFNLMASLSLDTNSRLQGSQRDFHNGNQPERGLAPDTTGTPYANISAAAGTAFPAGAIIPGSTTAISRFNPLVLTPGGCEQIANQYLYRSEITGNAGNRLSCSYDYGKDWSLMQPVDRINLVSRGTFALNSNHNAFIELTASQVKSAVQYTPNQITTVARGANYPAYQQTFVLNTDGTRARDANGNYLMRSVLDAGGNRVRSPHYVDLTGQVPGYNREAPIRIRWRCEACGDREQLTTSETFRALLGAEGNFGAWDYKVGWSVGQSEGDTVYGAGNQIENRLKAAMDTGLVNPFLGAGQSQSAEALALLDWASAAGRRLYGGKAKVDQFDASVSGELFKLPAGSVGMAAGVDLRRESYNFRNDTTGGDAIVGAGSPSPLDEAKRNIKAVFAELNVPIVKGLEAQLAVRSDRYSDFGSTTNPKVALSWRPNASVLLRGSVNRGFHAPDFGPLFEGENPGQFTSDVSDPTYDVVVDTTTNPPTTRCVTAFDPRFCNLRPATASGGNPNLKPEKSKQWSLGIVVEPTDWMSASVDVFSVKISDRISNRTPQEVLDNNVTQFIARNLPTSLGGDGDPATIDAVQGGWINLAGDKVTGADISVAMRFDTGLGKVGVNVDGTYLKSYKTRKFDTDPWSERVGEFGDFDFLWDLKLKWKHTASVTLDRGDWSTTLTQVYKSGYKTEVDGYGSGVILQDLGFPSKVKAYTLYNLSASYKGIKNATLTLGVKNLFDRDPPFSNHNVDNVAGAGWDARVGDPRGRSIVATYTYKFF
jgi:iron complex outermembrane recepter protein